MESQITFNGFPVTFEAIDGEIFISCKGVTGTLSDVDRFFNSKSKHARRFGTSKIRLWNKGFVKIDCLEDTLEKGKEIFNYAKKLKDEQTNS